MTPPAFCAGGFAPRRWLANVLGLSLATSTILLLPLLRRQVNIYPLHSRNNNKRVAMRTCRRATA